MKSYKTKIKGKKLKILFLHRGFPGQFKFLSTALSQIKDFEVTFITSNQKGNDTSKIRVLKYCVSEKELNNAPDLLKQYERAILHGQKAAQLMNNLKKEGYEPDIIIGHSWGNTLFVKDIYPNVPFLCYFEWFQNADGAVEGFNGIPADENKRLQITCDNAYLMPDLCSCDGGLSPTEWQKKQFPKDFQHKIQVIHDGVDIDVCKPDKNAVFTLKEKNLEFTTKDEIITFATRGMEPMRGFPQFMEAIEKVLKTRPNAQVLIAGIDKVFYGNAHKSHKDEMLSKLDLDLNRIHFVGELPFEEYINLLQVSSCHVYLTYPFVLSWSFIEALSVGCCMICSNTEPVLEVIQDGFNGILTDFFDTNMLAGKIGFTLDNKEKSLEIKKNARQTAMEKYDARKLLPKHLAYINSFVKGGN